MQKRTPIALFAAVVIACSNGYVATVSAESDLDFLLDRMTFADAPKEIDKFGKDRSTQLVSDVDEDAVKSLSDVDAPAPLADAPAAKSAGKPQPAAPLVDAPIDREFADPLERSVPMASTEQPPPLHFQPVDQHQPSGISPACDCAQHGCRNGCAAGAACDPGYICQPHVTPNLPSSTLRQYFRGNPCNAHLWDGYAQERQQYCDKYHKHIHDRCECGHRGQCESCVLGRRPLDSALLRASGRHACKSGDGGCDGHRR